MQPVADDGGDANLASVESGPEGARMHAQEQEESRVTLFRAMHTLHHMLCTRGFRMTAVGNVPVACAADVQLNIDRYKSSVRARRAEEVHELLMEACAPDAPAQYSAVWAQAIPPGTKLAVFVISQGNVDAMRELQHAMAARGMSIAVIISRKALTAFSKRFLLSAAAPGLTLQHFRYEELQAAVVRHALVQPHLPLNAKMAERVRARFARGKLSRLRLSDPVVRFLGLPAGVIVMVREAFGRQQAFTTFFEVKDVA
jgi:DNA-directed RNA polymerase subunit H (RpoH/RPB5)